MLRDVLVLCLRALREKGVWRSDLVLSLGFLAAAAGGGGALG